jgi:hypothetical protein
VWSYTDVAELSSRSVLVLGSTAGSRKNTVRPSRSVPQTSLLIGRVGIAAEEWGLLPIPDRPGFPTQIDSYTSQACSSVRSKRADIGYSAEWYLIALTEAQGCPAHSAREGEDIGVADRHYRRFGVPRLTWQSYSCMEHCVRLNW